MWKNNNRIKSFKLLEIEHGDRDGFKYLFPVVSKALINKLATAPDGFPRAPNQNFPNHLW